MRYREADIVQKGAFNRAVYGFALLVIAGFLASYFPEMRWLVKPSLAIWQFTLLTSLPMLLGFFPSDDKFRGKTPNVLFTYLSWCLTISFFMGRPGFSTGYRIFRAFLGVFLAGMALAMTLALLPLLMVELTWVGVTGRFMRTNPGKS